LRDLGRQDEGLAIDEALVRHDPVNPGAFDDLGLAQTSTGQFDGALQSFRTALSLSPVRGRTHHLLGVAMRLKGAAPAALPELHQEASEAWRLIGLPMVYHALGRKAESDASLAELIAKYEKDAPVNIASVYAFRGESVKAFEWLDKAVEYQDAGLAEI